MYIVYMLFFLLAYGFYRDYEYSTMLTTVQLFLTFLLILSVCFVSTPLSISLNCIRLAYHAVRGLVSYKIRCYLLYSTYGNYCNKSIWQIFSICLIFFSFWLCHFTFQFEFSLEFAVMLFYFFLHMSIDHLLYNYVIVSFRRWRKNNNNYIHTD